MPRVVRIALALALLAGIGAAALLRERIDTAAVEQWVAAAGVLGPAVFMGLYALGTVLFLPGSVMTLAGGALFGPVWGTLYNLTGATLGAALAFVVARHLASDWVAARAGPRLTRLMEGVAREGWRFVAFVRLVPLFPFNLLNYALGLTRVRFWPYVLATWVFMLPGAVAYTYLGYAGREALAGGEGLVRKVLIALGLLAAVAFLPRLAAQLRAVGLVDVRTLADRLAAEPEAVVLDVRTPEEFTGELGHIEGALNIPVQALAERLDALSDFEQRPVYVICRTDRRSRKAARVLAGGGFARVYVVRGGMIAWNEQGLPVVDRSAPG